MSQTPLLSVVIATRNRHKYAMPAVRSLSTLISAEDAEFVIQDSSDEASLGDYIRNEIRDPRVRYYYAPPPLNMTENFNLAMANATGRYVCTIGDDDGVSPEIVDATRWAEANNVDALTATTAAYYWPDFRSRYYGDRHAAKVYLKRFSGEISRLDAEQAVRRLCTRNAALGVEEWGLPKVYLGLIRRDRMEEIRLRTGCYFGGISPDIYGAITAGHVCRNFLTIDYPLIMGGNSGGSNAGLSAARRHKGTFEEAAHMRNYSVSDWPTGVPRYWTTETAFSTSALRALKDLGREDLIRDFNYTFLHAACLLSHPDYYAETLRSFADAPGIQRSSQFGRWSRLVLSSVREGSRRLGSLGTRLLSPGPAAGAAVCPGLKDIEAAIRGLVERLKADSVSFSNYAKDSRL